MLSIRSRVLQLISACRQLPDPLDTQLSSDLSLPAFAGQHDSIINHLVIVDQGPPWNFAATSCKGVSQLAGGAWAGPEDAEEGMWSGKTPFPPVGLKELLLSREMT